MQNEFTFKKYAWQQFKANKPGLFSLYVLIVLVGLAVLSPFIANQQPLYAKYGGKTFYPAFQTLFDAHYGDTILDPISGQKEFLQFNGTHISIITGIHQFHENEINHIIINFLSLIIYLLIV